MNASAKFGKPEDRAACAFAQFLRDRTYGSWEPVGGCFVRLLPEGRVTVLGFDKKTVLFDWGAGSKQVNPMGDKIRHFATAQITAQIGLETARGIAIDWENHVKALAGGER